MKSKHRKYISLYFHDGLSIKRKKRDLTISFDADDPLFEKCKELGSSGIKNKIGIQSYEELLSVANQENRSLSNYIKHKLTILIK